MNKHLFKQHLNLHKINPKEIFSKINSLNNRIAVNFIFLSYIIISL
jgi:hypothetical protein